MRHAPLRVMTLICLCAAGIVAGAPGASLAAVEWTGLRGPGHDGAVRDARLFADGGKPGLTLAWKKTLGSGYASIVTGDGRVITMFAAGDADVAAAFDAATGAEIWRYRIDDAYKGHDGSHDGPIASPTLSGGRLFGLSPRGLLFALDAATGKAIWSHDVAKDFEAKMPFYGFSSSPIVVEGVLVVQIGAGEGKSVAGFNPGDGKLLWSAGDDPINYHSPIAAEIGGKTQVLSAGGKTLVGIEPATGKVLWSFAHEGDEAAMGGETVTPVPAGDGRFLLKNKNDSSVMVKVTPGAAGAYEVTKLWSNNSIARSYVMPVYLDGFLYGVTGRTLTCVDAATGESKWRSREPGDGFPTLVGKHLVIITKPGTLHVVDASPAGYNEVARLNLFEEQSWSAVAFSDGHLYARSMGHLARVDVGAGGESAQSRNAWVASTAFGRFLDETAKSADKKAAVDAYLAKQKSFPIIEDSGAVHFVYRGEARDVAIVGDMIGFRREDPMTRLAGTDLFHYSTRLEPDAAVTYGFLVDFGKATPDPKNPRPGSGLFGEVSWFSMPAWRGPSFDGAAAKTRQGRLEDFEIDSAVMEGKKQKASVYLPTGYDGKNDRRYPVLYVFEGKEALEKGGMKDALDNLLGSTVEPLIAVFLIAGDESQRRGPKEVQAYTSMIVTEMIPKVDAKYRTIASPAARAAVGQAGGAEAALSCAFGHPEVFGRVGSEAATMMTTSDLSPLIPGADQKPMVVYLGWGTYHLRSPHEAWDMARANRELWAMLRERGYRPAGGEVPEGFGWACWRAHLDDMFASLFPLKRN